MIKMYSRDLCTWCDKLRDLLDSLGLEFKEFKLGDDFTRDEMVKMVPEKVIEEKGLTLPQIWVHGEYIGGYTDFAEYADQHGMMGLQT